MKTTKRLLKKLPSLKKRERSFEYRLRDYLRDEHGVMFVKAKPTRRGLPDRWAAGFENLIFVELKREKGELDEHQRVMHAELRRLTGKYVLVVWGPDVTTAGMRIVQALRTW